MIMMSRWFGCMMTLFDRTIVYFNFQLSNPPFFPCPWRKTTLSPGIWLTGGWKGGRETKRRLKMGNETCDFQLMSGRDEVCINNDKSCSWAARLDDFFCWLWPGPVIQSQESFSRFCSLDHNAVITSSLLPSFHPCFHYNGFLATACCTCFQFLWRCQGWSRSS